MLPRIFVSWSLMLLRLLAPHASTTQRQCSQLERQLAVGKGLYLQLYLWMGYNWYHRPVRHGLYNTQSGDYVLDIAICTPNCGIW